MTERQTRWLEEYEKSGNATQAAKRAGFSAKTARQAGARMLSDVAICAVLTEHRKLRAEQAGVEAADVIRELARIGFSDMRQFTTWGVRGVALNESGGLTDDEARCVAEVSQTTSPTGGSLKFKLHDKVAALTLLGKHLALFTDKVEHSGAVAMPQVIVE